METALPGQGPERRFSEIPTPHQIFTSAQEKLLPTEEKARNEAKKRRLKSDSHRVKERLTGRTLQRGTAARGYELRDYHAFWSTAFDTSVDYITEQERLLTEKRSVLGLSILDENGYEIHDMPRYLMFLPAEASYEILGEDGLNITIPTDYPKDQPAIARTRVNTDDPDKYIVLNNPGEDELLLAVYQQWQEPKTS